jgi:hypothetical protein
MRTVFIIICTMFFLGCKNSSSKKWSESDKTQFMNSCVANATTALGEGPAREYCSCMLEKIEKKYPNSKDSEQITMGQTIEMAKDCRVEPDPSITNDTLQNQ